MNSDTVPSITDRFIDLLVEKSLHISDSARAEAETALIDFIGCAAQGSKQGSGLYGQFPHCESARSTVIGVDSYRTFAEQAAYINAYNAHSTELDDGYKPGMTHIGAVVVAAVLALAEEREIGMDKILEAIVMGYEATARLSRSINPGHKKRGFHTTGTCGTIGAAVACTLLLSGDRHAVKTAISAAATSAAGLLEIQEQGSQLKAVNAAHAAATAVTCARMAMASLDAPDDILGGPRGFAALLTAGIDETKLLGASDGFEISHRYMKLYPACRHCHPAIESALQASKGIAADEISGIRVRTYALAIKGHDHKDIKGISSAKLSIPFCVALAVSAQAFSQAQLDACDLNDSIIRRLMSVTEIVEEPDFTAAQVNQRAAIVEITTQSGAHTSAEVRYAKGDPENPLTADEIRAKFTESVKGTTLSAAALSDVMFRYAPLCDRLTLRDVTFRCAPPCDRLTP